MLHSGGAPDLGSISLKGLPKLYDAQRHCVNALEQYTCHITRSYPGTASKILWVIVNVPFEPASYDC